MTRDRPWPKMPEQFCNQCKNTNGEHLPWCTVPHPPEWELPTMTRDRTGYLRISRTSSNVSDDYMTITLVTFEGGETNIRADFTLLDFAKVLSGEQIHIYNVETHHRQAKPVKASPMLAERRACNFLARDI